MKKKVSGRTKFILIFAVFLAVVTAVSPAIFGTTFLDRGVQAIMTPLRSGFSSITRQVERYYNYLFGYEALEAENRYLNERINEMEADSRNIDALERENERLRALLELQSSNTDYHFCEAYIVAWDAGNWKSTFTIAKGTDDALEQGMVAVTEFGQVVGTITSIGPNWATITTILDTSHEVSASIVSSGYTGIVQGNYTAGEGNSLRINYLPTSVVLRNNDQVVTTGSSVYPKDLIIGYITSAGYDETGVAKYATLTPAADLDTLEQVFIITEFTQ